MLIFILYFLMGLVFLVASATLPDGVLNVYNMFFSAAIAIIGYVGILLYRRRITGLFQWVNAFNLFSVGFIIVYFQFVLLLPIYSELAEYKEIWHGGAQATRATLFAVSGFFFYLGGYALSIRIHYVPYMRIVSNSLLKNRTLRVLVWVLTGLASICLVLVPLYSSERFWAGQNADGLGGYSMRLLEWLMYSAMILEIYRLKNFMRGDSLLAYFLGFDKILMVYLLAFCALFIYVGDRSYLISVALMTGCGYAVYIRPIKAPLFFSVLVGGILFMSGLMLFRTSDFTYSSMEKIQKARASTSYMQWYEYSGELATSVNTLNIAMIVWPEEKPHTYGEMQLNSALGSIPFMNSRYGLYSTAHLITWYLFGMESEHGAGSCVMADLYIDFSFLGAVLMIFLGWAIGFFEFKSCSTDSIYYTCVYLIMCSFAIYWNRSGYLSLLPNLTMVMAVVVVLAVIFGLNMKKRLQ